MSSRFELDGVPGMDDRARALSAAPEAVDDAPARSRFVVEDPESDDVTADCDSPGNQAADLDSRAAASDPVQPNLICSEADASWRSEVADRVNRYRARRRPRAPRYPSLTLKFEAPETRSSRFPSTESSMPATRQSLAMDSDALTREETALSQSAAPAEIGKLLEFPRSLTLPPQPLDELADPVFDRPRILEVPDVAPPPPALGGILIEPAEERVEEKRPGFEMPLQPARLSRRLAAAAVDGFLVLTAGALFAYIFFRVTAIVPPLPLTMETSFILAAVLWASYQYLALVFTGTTPGLKLAKLDLNRFEGDAVPRRVRQWRVLASFLSAVSLGLGYAWCFLDEDQLCWHDRITRTYMAPK